MTAVGATNPHVPRGWRPAQLATAAALIVVATVVAYLPAVRGGFLWDDDAHVTKPELRSAHGLYRIWFDVGATQQYYPLLHSAFWVQHQLWGDAPAPYHVVNIALHACAVVLVMLIVRRLLSARGFAWADPAAFLTAAVFALHPVHVESVAWITEQKNTLSAVFYLAAMLTYLRFDQSRRKGCYALATGLFVLALLAKPVTVTLPPALLVVFWWLRGRLSLRRDVVPLLPWFVFSLASGLFAAWVERAVIGAEGDAFALSGEQRLLLPSRVIAFYLGKLLWPNDLIFVYPRWTVDAAVWWQWLFPAGAASVTIALIVLARRTRAPLAAFLFYCGSLFPVLGFFNVYLFLYTYVADHFQYLPSLGIIVLICGALAAATGRIRSPEARTAVLVALPAVLGALTFRQCRMYADVRTIYEITLAKNPDCWMACNNLGIVLADMGEPRAALDYYDRALQLRPRYPEALNNKGVTLSALRRSRDAIEAFENALQLRPSYCACWENIIDALSTTGRPLAAVERGAEALRHCPENPRLLVNLGIAHGLLGQQAEAVDRFEQAVRLDASFAAGFANLAIAYDALGRVSDAIDAGERALHLARIQRQQDMVVQLENWLATRRSR